MFRNHQFDGEYVIVYSRTNRTVGKHIKEVLTRSRFKNAKDVMNGRIIWLCEKILDKSPAKVEDIKEEKDFVNDRESIPEFFTSDVFGSGELPKVVRIQIDPLTPVPLKNLRLYSDQIHSAILFSDEPSTDGRLPLLIGLLKKYVPNIGIAAEFNDPEAEPYLWEAGADEVFNRNTLWNHTTALTILNKEQDNRIYNFITTLVQSEENKNKELQKLGLKCSYICSIRLSIKKKSTLFLNGENWDRFRELAKKWNIRPIGVFHKKQSNDNHEDHSKYGLKKLHPKIQITLKNGDCVLALTYSSEILDQFMEEVIQTYRNEFVKEIT